MTGDHVRLVHRRKTQAPAPWVIWEALCDPFGSEDRPWFDVRADETPPAVLSMTKPRSVAWSTIWRDRPELTIEFLIEPDGGGSIVTWALIGPEGDLDDADIRQRRYRLDQLINGQLRYSFD